MNRQECQRRGRLPKKANIPLNSELTSWLNAGQNKGMLISLRSGVCFTLLGAFTAIFLCPCSASAKLGENLPALIRRFGSNYHSGNASSPTRPQYKFESKACTVVVTLSNGRSVSECYSCFQPLVDGRPPENIWRGIREKNVPGAKWKPNENGGYVSEDARYSTWFTTERLDQGCTCAIGIWEESIFGENAAMPPDPPDYARWIAAVLKDVNHRGQAVTREQGYTFAKNNPLAGDIEAQIATYRRMGCSEEFVEGVREGARTNGASSKR